MGLNSKRIFSFLKPKLFSAVVYLLLIIEIPAFAQPANDNCTNASIVNISSGGFGLGVFASSTFDLTSATVQAGETFAPAILVAGQNQKSIWYKFILPTSRSVRVTLAQTGSAITAGDAGFAVYKTNNCLPTGSDISTKLTPIGIFGNSFHPCVEAGEYLVQVSGKAAANGPVYITVELTRGNPSVYDLTSEAYVFGNLNLNQNTHIDFNVDCQSIDDSSEICLSSPTLKTYTKSTWHVFTSPNYFDWIAVAIAGGSGGFDGTKISYRLYQGDVRVTPVSSLVPITVCDSLVYINDRIDAKSYVCGQLNTNTAYTIQLMYPTNLVGIIRLAVPWGGTAPTRAPQPVNTIPVANQLGALPGSPTGITTNAATDYFGCNARHINYNCPKSLPQNGLSLFVGNTPGGVPKYFAYNLSNFYSFTISNTANVAINTTSSYYGDALLYLRLYKQSLTASCIDLDTANIVARGFQNLSFECMTPGDYVLQVMGTDSGYTKTELIYNYTIGYLATGNPSLNMFRHLGTSIGLGINVRNRVASNLYSLATPGAFDTLNHVSGVMQPMVPGVTYTSNVDTFGCANSVMPLDPNCSNGYTKTMYREFIVPDSGMISMWSGGPTDLNYKIFKGDANALAVAQSVFTYPNTISGLTPVTLCMSNTGVAPYVCDYQKVCVTPGTYSEAVYGNVNQIAATNQFRVRFNTVTTVHYDLAHAEDMGGILSIIPPTGGSVTSAPDYYSCKDNAIIIDGFVPCTGGYGSTGTKAIFRQFYLSSPASISISSQAFGCDNTPATLFKGKATDGISALTVMPAPYRCFTGTSTSVCDALPAGWYTVVSYGWGPSYQNPTRDLNDVYFNYPQYSSTVGYGNKISITLNVSTCPKPKYNRPYKAAIDTLTNQPFLIEWGPRAGHTAAYPKTDTTYTLYTENFLCNDTPFVSHPLQPCDPTVTKVAYYVFRTTQESFIRINTNNYWNYAGFAYRAAVYAGNVRTDSVSFGTASPIQPCIESIGQIQLCKLQPGTYTLVVFAPPSATCNNVTPYITIDKVGYSRFDHANNAYDFGVIPPDSIYHNGKVGDINPLDPGRAPSSDIFYCTTGSQPNDPVYGCGSVYLPSIYGNGNNLPAFTSTGYDNFYGAQYPRRNLWYTFVVDKGGWVRVKVKNKTIGKTLQYPFFVAKSDVNGLLPFSTIVSSGGVDSTVAQGLYVFGANAGSGNTCVGGEEVVFYREACSPVAERYYIIVQNPPGDGIIPNHQVEVSVLFDSVNAIQPQFDHYYQASNIGNNITPGTYTGATDNFSCATRDATDPISASNCGTKTLWYKFSINFTGLIKNPGVYINGDYNGNDQGHFNLYRQIIPGDSTFAGLEYVALQNGLAGPYTQAACITPGTYYILLPTCGYTSGTEYPVFELIENTGDYCSRPVVASLSGAGTSVTSALINCHTIGSDYGEFNPTLTCPAGAVTNQYKSSWFKINITGTDTLDVTTYLSNNTSVPSTQIKYRLMNGDCSAMQERSCVQDALTQDTYKCLAPGDYWVQVFSPANATGTIDLHLTAVHHADTCAPINSCLSNANFQKQFDCTQSTAVRFINYSTFGSSVSYQWNFGYNGQTSAAVSPQFVYPSLSISQTYYITLTVTNNSCGGQSTYSDSITIPARPVVNLGADTSLCDGGSVMLNATSWPGATYLWNTNATSPTITVSATGQISYIVTVTYNGCIARDTIRVNIDPILPLTQYKYICGINSVQLNSARGLNESHYWSTGATTSFINVFNPGIYWDDISLNGCITRDSFIVATAAYPLGNDRQVCFGGQPVLLNATTQGATAYAWQSGTTGATFNATTAGLYWVDISFGSCTLRDTVVLSNLQPLLGNIGASICQGQIYTLPSGNTISVAGIYSDTTRSIRGCDSLINTVNLAVQTVAAINTNAAICPGQTYTLPWGAIVNATGIYRDTLRYTTGCDSVRRAVNLVVQTATSAISNPVICAGQTYTLPWGTIVNTTGVYRDTLHYTTGCDSVWRAVNLTVQSPLSQTLSPIICAGQTYTLPWGTIVNAAGMYRDTLHYTTGCDSVRRTVNLTVQTPASQTFNPVICSGQTYTLPWGTIVSASGVYRDTLRYTTGCDSVRRTVSLTVEVPLSIVTNPTICTGQSYTLPWGTIVNTPGVYMDTLRSIAGCDSIRRTVNLTILTATSQTFNPVICEGTSYTLPWGAVVSTAGIYRDTLHGVFGCDSVRRTVNLTVQSSALQTTNPVICAGQTYTLPWGAVVNTAGVYRDTLRYTTGCDSVRRAVNLIVQSSTLQTINPIICAGQTYTLPWGAVVNTAGVYRDTLHYTTGCDSVWRTVNLTVQSPTLQTFNPIICAGQTYTLPWGTVVSTSGVYRDTLHYTTGCDSLRRTVNLTVQSSTLQTTNPIICAGQTYTLPWGTIVNTAGVYRDTLHYTTGCDSVRRIVNLTVQSPASVTTNPIICASQTYTLPWGTIVNTAGVYRDTLHYTTGCDSVWRTVNLTVQSPLSQTFSPIICAGQTYTLPWGAVVSTSGVYRDTLHYTTGCDSIRRTVNLTVQSSILQTTNPVICAGQTYTLPWGAIVNTAGVYRDTLHYTTGCDSIRRTVNLTVQSPSSQTTNPIICTGQTYTLPWGTIVNTAGVYRDTLHYTSGCDSVRRTVNLTIQSSALVTTSSIICAGQIYTLPWGAIVNSSGIYRDTLHYTTGCDSIRRIVNLTVQSPASQTFNPVICQGGTYTLPWGAVVNTAGTYRDTLHYRTGCDSVRRTVNLTVTAAAVSTANATICSDEIYTLPWGTITNIAGIYKDTVRTRFGCDSLIRTVNLRVDPAPSVSVTKSNDVDCMLGIAKLEASGGVSYTWTPAASLNNATIYNPVASPTTSTWYKVLVTSDKGCTTEDSVQVKVITGNIQNGYLVPNAFTPNGDGKNDCFGVQTWGYVTDFSLSVFNRWGQRIFYTTKPSDCWDGTYKGKEQNPDVYVYQITAKGFCGDIYRKGTFTLIR